MGTDARRGTERRRLVRRSDRVLRDLPDVDGYESDEYIQNGYDQSMDERYSDEDEEEDSASEASDIEESSPERRTFTVYRQNIHD